MTRNRAKTSKKELALPGLAGENYWCDEHHLRYSVVDSGSSRAANMPPGGVHRNRADGPFLMRGQG